MPIREEAKLAKKNADASAFFCHIKGESVVDLLSAA